MRGKVSEWYGEYHVQDFSGMVVGGAVISLGVLDERTWNAIGVVAAAVGELRDPTIYNWTLVPYKQYRESAFPVPIPLGHEVSAEVMSINLGASRQYMRCTVKFKDPDGLTKGSHAETFYLDFGGAIFTATTRVTINKEGTWKLHALLEAI